MIPRATIRLQFHKDFTLDEASRHVSYFAALGVSHVYSSPLQKARAGSLHGYDVVDHDTVNPEIGGEAALRRFSAALRERQLGLIMDIVPNHMAASFQNPWWWCVLEGGRASPHAHFFDIDWEPADAALHGKVLAPFLAKPYGEVLRDGTLGLKFDAEKAAFYVEHYDQRFPIALLHYAEILSAGGGAQATDMASLFKTFHDACADKEACNAARLALVERLSDNDYRVSLQSSLDYFSTASDEGAMRLHALLERQHYRLAWWRCAAEEINWRRFFEVSDLIGIRVERSEVFEATHALVFRLYAEGIIDGVRIDHVDGLANPREYCQRVRARLESLAPQREQLGLPTRPYIIVEKILAEGEALPPEWQTDGTTGYDYMNDVGAFLHDTSGRDAMNALWRKKAVEQDLQEAQVSAIRARLLSEHFVGEFDLLARALHRVARADLNTRDIALGTIRRSLTALLANFTLYRTYCEESAEEGRRSEHDEQAMTLALEKARAELNPVDHETLEWLNRWLGCAPCGDAGDADRLRLRRQALRRFQQLTPPLAAKAIEDTFFYRYARLLSRNEVGSDPGVFAIDAAEYHRRCEMRAAACPHTMLTTATHDHKRGEDARARLAVLSEIPDLWQTTVEQWFERNATQREDVQGVPRTPDTAEEYALYQMLVGAWPPDMSADESDKLAVFKQRIGDWQQKSLREAKRRTSWQVPDDQYEKACQGFLERLLQPPSAMPEQPTENSFLADLESFVSRIECAGIINSLTQTTLRLTSPGVPDLYQGTELWDFSLVDPDNRRAVDYDARAKSLEDARSCSWDDLLTQWRDGRLKQAVVAHLLELRKRMPTLFEHGDYLPLEIQGPVRENAIAYARRHANDVVIIIATHRSARLLGGRKLPHVDRSAWQDTAVMLPCEWNQMRDLLTGTALSSEPSKLALQSALGTLPVAVITARAT